MTASLWPTVAANLAAVWGALDLTGPDNQPVRVWEGVPYGWDDMSSGIAIGVDTAYPEGSSGSIEQAWRDAGPAPFAAREETGEIVCSCWVSTGDDDMPAVRDAAFSILDALWAAINTITVLDPSGHRVTDAHIVRADPLMRRQNGCLVEIPFRLRYRATI